MAITHFSGASDNWHDPIIINDQPWFVENGNRPWNLTELNSDTLRVEVRPGDTWAEDGSARSEILTVNNAADHQVFNAEYTMTIEPGKINSKVAWLSLAQMHEDSGIPFSIQLVGDHMSVVVNLNSSLAKTIYTDPNPIVRGHAYDIQIRANFATDSGGFLQIWRDGAKIVDYHGQLGTENGGQYLKLGIYEGYPEDVSQPMAVDYSSIILSYNDPNFHSPGSSPPSSPAPAPNPAPPSSGQIAPNGFDAAYYLAHNPDVAAAHVDPLQHYETFGWKEGRDPNAYFNDKGYLATYGDVAAAGVNPLDHYNTYGWHEGRDPSVSFDTTAYLSANPDVAAAHVNPLTHFLQFGLSEHRSPAGDGVWG